MVSKPLSVLFKLALAPTHPSASPGAASTDVVVWWGTVYVFVTQHLLRCNVNLVRKVIMLKCIVGMQAGIILGIAMTSV